MDDIKVEIQEADLERMNELRSILMALTRASDAVIAEWHKHGYYDKLGERIDTLAWTRNRARTVLVGVSPTSFDRGIPPHLVMKKIKPEDLVDE